MLEDKSISTSRISLCLWIMSPPLRQSCPCDVLNNSPHPSQLGCVFSSGFKYRIHKASLNSVADRSKWSFWMGSVFSQLDCECLCRYKALWWITSDSLSTWVQIFYSVSLLSRLNWYWASVSDWIWSIMEKFDWFTMECTITDVCCTWRFIRHRKKMSYPYMGKHGDFVGIVTCFPTNSRHLKSPQNCTIPTAVFPYEIPSL